MFIQWVLSYLKLGSCLFIRLILPKIELMFIHEFIIQVPFCPEQPLLFRLGLFFLLYLFVFTLHAICVGEGHAVLWTNQIAVLVGRVHDDVIVVDVLLLWRPITARWTLWRHREKYRKMFSLSSFQYNAQYILTCIIQHLFPMHYLTLMFIYLCLLQCYPTPIPTENLSPTACQIRQDLQYLQASWNIH